MLSQVHRLDFVLVENLVNNWFIRLFSSCLVNYLIHFHQTFCPDIYFIKNVLFETNIMRFVFSKKSAVWTNSFFAIDTNNFKFFAMSRTHVYSEHDFLFNLLGSWLCNRLWSWLCYFLFLLLCFIFIGHFNHGEVFGKLFSFLLPSNRSPRNEMRNSEKTY